MGTAGMIITDKLVDEKTHIYDDETHGDGKGRNASSQLAWQLAGKAWVVLGFSISLVLSGVRVILDHSYNMLSPNTPGLL